MRSSANASRMTWCSFPKSGTYREKSRIGSTWRSGSATFSCDTWPRPRFLARSGREAGAFETQAEAQHQTGGDRHERQREGRLVAETSGEKAAQRRSNRQRAVERVHQSNQNRAFTRRGDFHHVI